jgi:subtilisin family serine protease
MGFTGLSVVVSTVAGFALFSGPAVAAPARVVVGFAPHASGAQRAHAAGEFGLRDAETVLGSRVQSFRVPDGTLASKVAARLEDASAVDYAEPDGRVHATVASDFDTTETQWALVREQAPLAWSGLTGAGPAVAVVDSGVDFTHPDLTKVQWQNLAETVNGRDDDGDGFVDDVSGWDWVDGDNSPDDDNGHGTHVTGTVAARPHNALGVTGVSFTSAVASLRVLDSDGAGYNSDVAAAFDYAGRMGFRVVNASLVSTTYSQAIADAIAAHPNTLYVAAAGNDAADNDTRTAVPCTVPAANVVCVAASTPDDALASFSDWGERAVDLAAPGTSIRSSYLHGSYARMEGTSMAAAQVAGAAALLLAKRPDATAPQLHDALTDNADPSPALDGKVVAGGRLNISRALEAMAAMPAQPPPQPPAARAAPAQPAVTPIGPQQPASPPAQPDSAPSVLPHTPTHAPAHGGAPASRPRLRLISAGRLTASSKSTVRVKVTLTGATGARCMCTVRLRSGRHSLAATRHATVKAVPSLTVTLRLTRYARTQLRRHRSLRARLTVERPGTHAAQTVTLRRAR